MSKRNECAVRLTWGTKAEWQVRPVGELLLPQTTINPLLSPDKTFSYIDVSSVSAQTFAIQETQTLFGREAPSRARKLVRTGNVIFATIRPTLKRLALIPEEFDGHVCSTGYVVLRPTSAIDPSYLFYWLFTKPFADQMTALQRGASYPAVSDADVRRQPIAFPVRTEQERIVAILGEACESIDAAKISTQTNMHASKRVFEAYRESIFRSDETTRSASLTGLAMFRNGVNFTRSSKGKTLQIIGVGDFQNRSLTLTEGLESVTIDGEVNEDDLLHSGDLLTVRSNGNASLIGRTMVTDDCPPNTLHSGFTIRTRLLRRDVFPKYLCQFVRSGQTRREMIDGGTGVHIKSLNQGTLGNLEVPLPPCDKQVAIAASIDEFSIETQRLEQTYK